MKTSDKIAMLTFGVAIGAIIMNSIMMWIWNNALVPAVDGVNQVTFFQMLGIFFLSHWLIFSYRGDK